MRGLILKYWFILLFMVSYVLSWIIVPLVVGFTFFFFFLVLFGLFFLGIILLLKSLINLPPPVIPDKSALDLKREKISDNYYKCDDSWLRLSKSGIWELFVKGRPFDMGVKNGILTEELAKKQEDEFILFLQEIIPSKSTLNYLKYFIAWFNKKLTKCLPDQLHQEIYGISLFAPKEYEFIAPNYYRVMNYHAAHDIGHTIQNMNLVACTAFSVNGELSKDNSLLIGRNLDFSAGDGFAREKIVGFCEPDTGFKFMYVTWAGMIGVVSGMNEHGLTVTLNSAKSDIPLTAKTPVSAISRMILQYAKTIDEAYKIAESYDSFVSECFFIGSAIDNTTAIIEKSLYKTVLVPAKSSSLILTNHYQSESLKDTKLNKESIQEGSTLYRHKRVQQLIDRSDKIDYKTMAAILRDQKGLDDEDIGMSNEKAINQLVCHHSVIFEPSKKLVWVSEFPYQIGKFVAYDLNKIFDQEIDIKGDNEINEPELTIAEDNFFHSGGYANFKQYKKEVEQLKTIISKKSENTYNEDKIETFINLNPHYYYTYYMVGEYYRLIGNYSLALEYYNKSLEKEHPREVDKKQVLQAKLHTKKRLN